MKKTILLFLLIGMSLMPFIPLTHSESKQDNVPNVKKIETQVETKTNVTEIKEPTDIPAQSPSPTPSLEIKTSDKSANKSSANSRQPDQEKHTNTTKNAGIVTRARSKDEIRNKICTTFGQYCKDALTIAEHENRKHDPLAISATGDYGVMQINCYWETKRQLKYNKVANYDCRKLLDADYNIEIAWTNFKRNGYSWKSWTTCKYLTKCY